VHYSVWTNEGAAESILAQGLCNALLLFSASLSQIAPGAQLVGANCTGVSSRPAGEHWQEIDGVFMLRCVRACVCACAIARARMRVHSVFSPGVCLHATFTARSCPPGHLLVNSTIDSQICLECGPGTYTVNMFQGCEEELCNKRSCAKCPVGVDCAKGLNPSWMHFVPKLLKLGGALLVAHSLSARYSLLCAVIPWSSCYHC